MEAPGEGSSPSAIVTPQAPALPLQTRVARRRLSQARHRATLAGLFSSLRKAVYAQSDLTASKWQVLNQAKNHIQELEHTLDSLLKQKNSFNLKDEHASTLEEVKEEYARIYSANDRYLSFYKQTMDLLTVNGIIAPQDVTLPVVSAAISHLWQTFSEERKASILQAWMQKQSDLPDPQGAYQGLLCVQDSGVDSQEATFSLISTPEEILFEDVFDLTNFLDNNEAPNAYSPSSVLDGYDPADAGEKFQLYVQIIDFFKGLCGANTELKQEQDPSVDDDVNMLRCMETFDDDL
ncbi:stimulated by retinoic acid gene 8 protein homolog isoform X2 [Oryctolagus cuniculus]|uniref:stimulated by retinoic acid gene 8 protein homolog isoform X2 n=1 Tax=Oryctolagus cuniculus TaxID=9986 RepID=UPI00222E41B1|nr:stimulated by retinoic acid gene 8 protein homolog isoform X2 [Oryctolagus cuniculus]